MDFSRLREIKIHDLLGLKDTGRRVSFRCPFHQDRTPSFSLYPDNSYHCFACGVHGSGAIDFLLETGVEMKEVVEELERYLNY